ncbi:biosynthetic arginine decarboxylase [Synechocystis salina LEGE 06099]|nr:biosynthetic arginine decarboxylase [Synechocystis salina]MBE9204068.1 biosynthetic arginine decarboxylase [Synechocystis salina LEGE 06099]
MEGKLMELDIMAMTEQSSQTEMIEESSGEKTSTDQAAPREKSWTIDDSENLYRITGWGEPYFSINAAGHVTVSPQADHGGALDLYELVKGLRQRNIGLPLLLRFSDILADRINRLNAAFARGIARYRYPNTYRGVYPIKCNQHRHIVESLVRYGTPYNFGLEAGSKPELMIALAMLQPQENPEPDQQNQPLLICNGYKDREYIETALLARRLGHRPIIVVEQVAEVALAIEISRNLGIKPILGVRAKLSTQGMGRWGISTGDRAKFGLTIPEMLTAIGQLRQADMLDSLQLLHFHIGSQISSISVIKEAMTEASQIFVQLAKLGGNMRYLDVGGGLGVDYDGSKTNFYASKNYNIQNYVNDVISAVQDACVAAEIPCPVLISESGRAIASHQSVLIFDIVATNDINPPLPKVKAKDHAILRNLMETWETITVDNYQEAYHDVEQFKTEAISLFNFGYLGLKERAKAEEIYWACCHKILQICRQQEYVPDDLENLEVNLASIYYANMSVFQSAPDSWAIDQLFPIMPIHRLDEEPSQRGILADITCDSDGKIDRFIDLRDVKSVLELHPLMELEQEGAPPRVEPYYLGMFLVGAYQEIMGNLHNLFGDINVVHIQMNPKGYQIEHLVRGDTIAEVLGYVQYDPEDLLENMRRYCEQAMEDKRMSLEESQLLLENYERSLLQYTYLKPTSGIQTS